MTSGNNHAIQECARAPCGRPKLLPGIVRGHNAGRVRLLQPAGLCRTPPLACVAAGQPVEDEGVCIELLVYGIDAIANLHAVNPRGRHE